MRAVIRQRTVAGLVGAGFDSTCELETERKGKTEPVQLNATEITNFTLGHHDVGWLAAPSKSTDQKADWQACELHGSVP